MPPTQTPATINLPHLGLTHPITLVAMPPQEYQAEYRLDSKALTLNYGIYNSRFGWVVVAWGDRGICTLQFLDPNPTDQLSNVQTTARALAEKSAKQLLSQQWPRAAFHPQGQLPMAPLPLWVKGTPFQLQVWQALLQIPRGQRRTYGQLARAIGKPRAARAVGNAVGKNPIACLIPCHRVVRASSDLGGYRWGRDRKAALLAWETNPAYSGPLPPAQSNPELSPT